MSLCGADTEANQLLQSLLQGTNITVPDIDLNSDEFKIPGGDSNPMYGQISKITVGDLTSGEFQGNGIFDVLMKAVSSQLTHEYEANRITGDDYTKAYIAMVQAAMQNSVQFLLGKDQAYWQATLSQSQAIQAKVELESTKVKYASMQFDALTTQANYALSKIRLTTEEIQYCTSQYNLNNILPVQLAGMNIDNNTKNYNLNSILPAQLQTNEAQLAGINTDNQIKTYNLTNMLPSQYAEQQAQTATVQYNLSDMLPLQKTMLNSQINQELAQTSLTNSQKANSDTDNLIKGYQLNYIMPAQLQLTNAQEAGLLVDNQTKTYQLNNILPYQSKYISEQYESQLAQTTDNRSDGSVVSGNIGEQKALYAQQIVSYKRDAEVKAAKIFTDPWMTMKTADDGLTAPNGFTNSSLDQILTALKNNNGLNG